MNGKSGGEMREGIRMGTDADREGCKAGVPAIGIFPRPPERAYTIVAMTKKKNKTKKLIKNKISVYPNCLAARSCWAGKIRRGSCGLTGNEKRAFVILQGRDSSAPERTFEYRL